MKYLSTSRAAGLLSLGVCIAAMSSTFAAEPINPVVRPEFTKYFERLDATATAPAALVSPDMQRELVKSGLSQADADRILVDVKTDICKNNEVARLCAYAGNDTVYKVRNLSWNLISKGATREEVLAATRPVFEYGIARNWEKIDGEKGISDSDLAQIASQRRLSVRDGSIACLGLATAIDQQTITTTNPVFAKDYRLVTCAIGLDVYQSWHIWPFPTFSFQLGFVLTHSRFARKVASVWIATGADPQICSTASAMGAVGGGCNNYSWSSPVAVQANLLFNHSQGAVYAAGRATKLGHNFGTQINF